MTARPTLRELFDAHDGKVADRWASYLEHYERLFAPFRDRPVRLLEIGVQNGGSLEIWAKYFNAATAIIGCDIDPACGRLAFDDDRIRVVVGDASDAAAARRISSQAPFDIVIDDGSHRSGDIVRAFARFFPMMRPGGLYVVEDLHCSYLKEYEGGAEPLSSMAFLQRLTDIANAEHWARPGEAETHLADFARRYGTSFDEASLASITSVSFANSLCIVTRGDEASTGLGVRLVTGRMASVEPRVVPMAGDRSTLRGELPARPDPASGEAAIDRVRSALAKTAASLASVTDERDATRDHVAALVSSRTWRYGRRLAVIANGAARARLMAGIALDLVPVNDIAIEPDGEALRLRIEGRDPHCELVWTGRGPLPPGHYRLSLALSGARERLDGARLYVDPGAGFSEDRSTPLSWQGKGPRFHAFFSLPTGATRLRLDLADRPSPLAIARPRLRLTGRGEHYGRLAWRRARPVLFDVQAASWAARRTLDVLRAGGIGGLAQVLRDDGHVQRRDSYEGWIARNEDLGPDAMLALRAEVEALLLPPLISVLMPVYNPPPPLLRAAIDSVLAQVYENWQLCVADDASTDPRIAGLLRDYAARDPRIKLALRPSNGHISAASNTALELVEGDWIALLDHDDILRPHALAEVALEIARHPDAGLIYSDEDKIDEHGNRHTPFFKPDFSRELFRSQNYLNHLTVHRTEHVHAVGGWRAGYEGSQDYDLNLRVFERIGAGAIRHIPKILYHWRAVTGSTAQHAGAKSYAHKAGLRALRDHVARTGLDAVAEQVPGVPFYRLRPGLAEPAPLVSLIIPTRDKANLLKGCVESIRSKTTYPNYELIVVDNGSREEDALAYLDRIGKQPGVRVLHYERPFNYSALNNFAVRQARGDFIGLVNNDIEVIAPDWLSEMVAWASLPDVGCVGARLLYGNDTIQHGGVIVGVGGVAGHSHKHYPAASQGYFGRLKVVQNLSAVTGACLVMRRALYEEVGGLNEEHLAVAFNDVDLCLKVREAGYLNVWTPHAELYHLESMSRGRDETPEAIERFGREVRYMAERWGTRDFIDPYYSPNLSRDTEGFELR
jgi:O-antigen biosynthesis protein